MVLWKESEGESPFRRKGHLAKRMSKLGAERNSERTFRFDRPSFNEEDEDGHLGVVSLEDSVDELVRIWHEGQCD